MNKTVRQTSVARQPAMLRANTASKMKKDAVSRTDMMCGFAKRSTSALNMVYHAPDPPSSSR